MNRTIFAVGFAIGTFVLSFRAAAQEGAQATEPREDATVTDGGAMAPAVSSPVAPSSADASASSSPSSLPVMSVDDGAPVGHAAPPTEAATRGTGPVKAGLEVFAQYSYRGIHGPGANRTWFHAFDVPRVHGALEGEIDHARGRVVLEATRSASEGSLVGVAGDSLVLRVREAYGAYRLASVLELSAGVIPTLTVPNLDGTWMLRAIAPSGLEANGLLSPADLGAKARVDLPRSYGWVAAAFYNGDGYTSRELNRGKTFEGAAEIHPLPAGPLKPLGVFGSWVGGSTGTLVARANRLTGGLVWQGERVRAGAYVTHGWGIGQLGTQRALLASAFVRVEPVPRVLVGARFDHVLRDAGGEPTDSISTFWATAGYRIAIPIESFLAFSRALPSARAQSELPGTDAWDLRVVGRVVF